MPTLVAAITIDTVPIGNPGNAPDPETGFGTVGYNYRMGTTEVTVGQYTAFLNAVAAEDQMQLYNPWMAPSYIDLTGTIARNGAPGGYTYSILGSANHPVTFVDWGDAARFANWLHNGQPSGPQDASTTEDGAYSLLGRTSVDHLNAITRNPGATWALPTENEWYKAAYHKNDGSTNSYWDYPTATNTAPLAEAPPGGANSANYENAVLSSFFLGMADVGSYLNSTSPYGTFDQAGNLMEWTEGIASPWLRRRLARGMSQEARGPHRRIASLLRPGSLLTIQPSGEPIRGSAWQPSPNRHPWHWRLLRHSLRYWATEPPAHTRIAPLTGGAQSSRFCSASMASMRAVISAA